MLIEHRKFRAVMNGERVLSIIERTASGDRIAQNHGATLREMLDRLRARHRHEKDRKKNE